MVSCGVPLLTSPKEDAPNKSSPLASEALEHHFLELACSLKAGFQPAGRKPVRFSGSTHPNWSIHLRSNSQTSPAKTQRASPNGPIEGSRAISGMCVFQIVGTSFWGWVYREDIMKTRGFWPWPWFPQCQAHGMGANFDEARGLDKTAGG